MTTFATDLDHLIRKHVGTTKCGDELLPIIETLYGAANRMARQADHYRWRDAFEDSGQKLVLRREAEAPIQKPPRKLVIDFEAMLRRREQVKDQRKRNQR